MAMPEKEAVRMQQLEFLLQRSGIYSRVMGDKLERGAAGPAAKRRRTETGVGGLASISRREQPSLLSGTRLKAYQMDGLIWLSSLFENGLNGILADEMGLGKTVQTIAFLTHLYEQGIHGPFLITAPLSTMSNWADEFARFAPAIPTLLYHGTKEERRLLQKSITANASVVITSFDIILRDRAFLGKPEWKFLVIDEGHRLKNLNSRLLRELKQFKTSNRLILTGTPLHNNLAELWALLNFVLPAIFDDLATFEEWFNVGAADQGDKKSVTSSFATWTTETATRVVKQLHDILKPFLLRRVKAEVEQGIPPKKEYLLYTPLSATQAAMYNHTARGTIRAWLVEHMSGLTHSQIAALRKASSKKAPREAKAWQALQDAERRVRAMRHENIPMHLRKICCHPYLMDWPTAGDSDTLRVDKHICLLSGKMCMLERILKALFAHGHRVLVFSQFTTMLDILELWATDLHHWTPYRIDGSTPQAQRASQVKEFNEHPEKGRLFLLSTRASGLGINLVGADTVVFYDSDWNPQVDLQAQDRVHRIGQTKPVLVFRLVAAGTIEQKMLRKADAKRILEAVVIQQGKFRNPITHAALEAGEEKQDPDALLRELEKTTVCGYSSNDDAALISDTDLDRLLDRSAEAYARHTGWQSTDGVAQGSGTLTNSNTALFEVTETSAEHANPALARLFSSDVDASIAAST
ncbi:Putative ATPase [Malassezia vespertilionis]|nr:Putative ATPase [Malassezia vespertilionis]WFD05971.1 Putative ATPase [Malassezia vespertilionis]